ncbi:MAG: sulfur transferase domain-containing protein [Rhodospirillaceae bacterium]
MPPPKDETGVDTGVIDKVVHLTPDFAIGPQPEAADFEALKAAGFAAVLNARPDDELGDYLKSDDARSLLGSLGLAYAHSPTENHSIFEPEIIDRFEEYLADLPVPVFAHCKSGTRAAILWALVAARHRNVESVIATLRTAGQELDFLEDEMRESAKSAEEDAPFRLKQDSLLKLGQSKLLGAGDPRPVDGPD